MMHVLSLFIGLAAGVAFNFLLFAVLDLRRRKSRRSDTPRKR